MKIEFVGASRQVTGSCYRISTETTSIVVDCGMFQGSSKAFEQNAAAFPFDASTLSGVVVTHAHLDHCGRIPKLVKEGFAGKIIGTEPTIALVELILDDAVHILEESAIKHNSDPLYRLEDVMRTKELFQGVQYHQKETIGDIEVELYDAGHILGSSIVVLRAEGKTLVFSGDLGNPPVPMLKTTETVAEADMVVMESTYGGRIHEDKRTRELLLKSAIYETVKMNGVLMIPAFALERTQEVLYAINTMIQNNDIPDVDIYLDSPLAIKATAVFRKHRSYFREEEQERMATDDFFHFPGLRLTEATNESKSINSSRNPKIIIAGSGMAEGGRIIHHIERYIGDEMNQYLIVGYQVEGSLGRKLLDGEKHIQVNGKEIQVKAKIRAIGAYSAHADRDKLTAWVSNFDRKVLKKVCITHGEEGQALALQHRLTQLLSTDVDIHVPHAGDIVEL